MLIAILNKENPLVSPLLGDLSAMPPSIIFVGGDEIMLDDSRALHHKLKESGCFSELSIAPHIGMLSFVQFKGKSKRL